MRVLFSTAYFQPAWDWGGPVRSMWNLTRGLVDQGAQVTVVTTTACQVGAVDVPPERVEDGVRILAAPALGRGRWRFANRQGISPGLWLRTALAVAWADIVHIDGFWGPAPAVAAIASGICRKPYIISTRGTLERRSLSAKRWKKRIALALGARRVIERAAGLHYTTQMEFQLSPNWAKRIPSFVVPNPVEVGSPADGRPIRARFGIDDDTVLLGMFGRLHRRKGLDVLLPALAVATARRKMKLLLVGPDEAGYRQTITRSVGVHRLDDSVILAGELSGADLARAYAAVDLLVLPSHGESFGNVVVEAAAQGTPCLVSDKVGLKDWVTEHRVGKVLPLCRDEWSRELVQATRKTASVVAFDEKSARDATKCFSRTAVAEAMLRHYAAVVQAQATGKRRTSPSDCTAPQQPQR